MSDTPESLLNAIIKADDLRRRARGQASTRAATDLASGHPHRQKILLEQFFNILGNLFGALMYVMPWGMRKAFVQWVNLKMSGGRSEINPQLPGHMAETAKMARDVKEKTGTWPAFLVLTSHPDTEGDLEWIRFELIRQGVQLADAYTETRRSKVEGRRSPISDLLSSIFRFYPHPKCFLAIDPFALDTVPTAVAGFYAGWMHRIYIAWDRQPSTQSWLQRNVLLRGTDYSRIAWRLLECLKKDVPVVMVIAGGLPYNARLLYAAREFVHRLRPAPWKISKRKAQLELMDILMKPDGNVWPADQGELPAGTRRQIEEALARWGLPKQKIADGISDFAEEFKRPVPYRARLFRVLSRRLLQRGKPLMVAAVSHRDTTPHVAVSAPSLIEDGVETTGSFSKLFP